MQLPLEYAQNIIVGVITGGTWRWYVTDRQLWVLDQNRYEEAFERKGYKVRSRGQYLERFGIGIVDEKTGDHFLQCIEGAKVTTEALRNLLLAEEREKKLAGDDWLKLIPALLVDFDARRLRSVFPESLCFENYVPAGWTGSYEDFLADVPLHERFWVVDGVDYFQKLGS